MTAVGAPADSRSCWAKMQGSCSKGTIQSAKSAVWFVAAMGSISIPIPWLSGLAMGPSVFMCVHEFFQRPNSVCMRDPFRSVAQSRNWKHVATGLATFGGIWTGGMVGMASDGQLAALASALTVISSLAALRLAYSNVLFAAGPQLENYAPVPDRV